MGKKSPEISPASASYAVSLIDHHSLAINHFRSRTASHIHEIME